MVRTLLSSSKINEVAIEIVRNRVVLGALRLSAAEGKRHVVCEQRPLHSQLCSRKLTVLAGKPWVRGFTLRTDTNDYTHSQW